MRDKADSQHSRSILDAVNMGESSSAKGVSAALPAVDFDPQALPVLRRASEAIAGLLGTSPVNQSGAEPAGPPILLDTAVFPLLHDAAESVAHAPDPEGAPRTTLPVDLDPSAIPVLRHATEALAGLLQADPQATSIPVAMDTGAIPVAQHLAESFMQALSDPESGSSVAADVDVAVFQQIGSGELIRHVSDTVREILDNSDEACDVRY